MNNLYILSALAFMASTLYLLYQRDCRRGRSARGNIFNDCSSLLTEASETARSFGFPTLKGNYKGYRVMLSAQVDTLSMRKVPPLWLTVTVIGKRPSHGSLDVLVRPQNTETYSPAWEWNDTLAIPVGWPQHAIAKYNRTVAPLDLVDRVVPGLFSDERMKELLITPDIVRITYLAKQADRGEYMLMRNAVFDGVPLQRDAVAGLLQVAASLRKELEGAMLE